MDFKAYLASAEVLQNIDELCRRRAWRDPTEADECYVYVLDGLQAHDFSRLRLYEGRSQCSFTTYFHTVVNSLIADFRRHKYGRRRIPAWVARLGAWAEALYRLVCWQRHAFTDACEQVYQAGLFKGSKAELFSRAEILQQTPCPEEVMFLPLDPQIEGNPPVDPPDSAPQNPLELLLAKLDHDQRRVAADAIKAVVESQSPEDQVLFRLVYVSDLPPAVAGRSLQLSSRVASRRLQKIVTRIREKLLNQGIREP